MIMRSSDISPFIVFRNNRVYFFGLNQFQDGEHYNDYVGKTQSTHWNRRTFLSEGDCFTY